MFLKSTNLSVDFGVVYNKTKQIKEETKRNTNIKRTNLNFGCIVFGNKESDDATDNGKGNTGHYYIR